MGIDTGSALVVGLPFFDVVEDADIYYEGGSSLSNELSCISPWYDADFESCILGYKLAGEDFAYVEIDPEVILKDIAKAKEQFLALTGKEAKVYVSPHVW